MKYGVLNEQGKFGAKIILRCTDIVIFVLGYFILTHPVHVQGRRHRYGRYGQAVPIIRPTMYDQILGRTFRKLH